MADLAVGSQIVRTNEVSRVDLRFLDELIDFDRTRRLMRDLLKLFLGNLYEGFPVQRVGLHDVLIRDFPTGLGIDFQIFDAVAGPTVELIEGNLLAFGRHDRASDEGKT
jgi:hypothetical protein